MESLVGNQQLLSEWAIFPSMTTAFLGRKEMGKSILNM